MYSILAHHMAKDLKLPFRVTNAYAHQQFMSSSLSPPQRLLKNMKFEGIEIVLEGNWYEDNR